MSNDQKFTDEDIAALTDLANGVPATPAGEEAETFSLLFVWREILSNIDKARDEHLDPAAATRILRAWNFLKIQEIPRYQQLYFDYLQDLRDILLIEIELEPEALNRTSHEEDAVGNKHHYLNLLLQWQLAVQEWGFEWIAEDPEAHIQVAALAEAQNFVLGERGLVAHLDAISFEFTDAESDELAALVDAARVDR